MTHPDDALGELMDVEPPGSLDALVFSRAVSELEGNARRDPPGSKLPVPERFIYVAGVAAYGGQIVYGLARLLVRALSG